MKTPLVPTVDFSPAKAGLSELMDDVFHRHRLQVISRHHGKEQMLLIRPEDLVAMVADQRLDVRVVYDGGEVTLRVPELGVLGFGDTLDAATEDLLAEVRVYVERFFEDPSRYLAGRGAPPLAMLRFALGGEDEQRAVLGIGAGQAQADVLVAH